jgi:trehalose 6-phosphate synthase/phosphatase
MFSVRLVIVSNRLPFTASFKEGAPQFSSSSGGLSTGLASYLQQSSAGAKERPDYFWLGWPGPTIASEQEALARKYGEDNFKCSPAFLSEESTERFYHSFCNKTIWPLFHFFPSLTYYEEGNSSGHTAVRKLLREMVAQNPLE